MLMYKCVTDMDTREARCAYSSSIDWDTFMTEYVKSEQERERERARERERERREKDEDRKRKSDKRESARPHGGADALVDRWCSHYSVESG